MKFNKLYALALGVLALSACSDCDDCLNKADDVTVELKEATMRFPEDRLSNTTLYNIPLVVNGEADGDIIVNVALKTVEGTEPAVADEHYIVTSTELIIPEGVTSVNVEFYPVGNEVINPNRVFEVAITNVKGAAVGANSTCEVTLVDNEGLIPLGYQNIQGTWTAKLNSIDDGPIESTFTILGAPEGDPDYEKYVYLVGFPDANLNTMIKAAFSVDGATEEPSVSWDLGVNGVLGTFSHNTYGVGEIILCNFNGNSLYDGGTATFVANPECDEMTLKMDDGFEGIGCFIHFTAGYMAWDKYTAVTASK